MERSQKWNVRDGNREDMEKILFLRKNVFGEEEKDKLDPGFWRWQFQECPDGRALIYVVEDKHRIIGHFADVPRLFFCQGETVLGTFSMDLMVHPDYRRKGIFDLMARYAVQSVKQKNGLFMITFPIRMATIIGLKKIGWREVGRLPVLVYPIRFHGVLNRYLRFPPLSLLLGGGIRFFYSLRYGFRRRKCSERFEIEKLVTLDESFDRFWEKASSLFPILGVRNRNFITWRFLQHPTRTYTIYRAKKDGEMRGYIVLRKVDLLGFNSGVIVDLLALDEDTLSALLERGIQHGRQEGDDLLGVIVPRGHVYDKLLRQKGFLPSPKTFLVIIYPQSDRKILFAPESWYVTWGDNDVI